MTQPRFALVPADQPATELEEALLARWREEGLFERTLEAREGAPTFVFYEGPPTANGQPGIHHVFARTIKDLFCRHRAMKGYRVERKAGWDTHGLPVEIEVEKRLGLAGKPDIEKLGVAEFNRLCRESVFTYRSEWERLSERIGYWLDYEHPYVTYTNDYIESVWWSLAALHRKGLLYRGHKILPYCARCGTALSSHEVAQGYQDDEDPSVYIALDLGSVGGEVVDDAPDMPGRTARRILVWTTTPWTLVSNAALAVHPDLMYVELQKTDSKDTRTIIMVESRAKAVLGDDYILRWTSGRAIVVRSIGCRIPKARTTRSSSVKASSVPTTAQGSCTCRRRSVQTTMRRAAGTTSRFCSRWTGAVNFPRIFRSWEASSSRTPTLS
jgi:isoleucyl-tRNA synthetase